MLSGHLTKAVEHFLDNGFVTEFDVSSVGLTPFRKDLENKLEQHDVKYESLAFEIKGRFMYLFYDVTEFPVYSEMKKFIIQYMEQRC